MRGIQAPSTTNETQRTANATAHQRCSECDDRLIVDQRQGERVCVGCGLVVEEDLIDPGPEWRAFNSEENEQRSRVGSPRTVLLHDKGMSSKIDWQNRDAHGNTLSTSQREKMQRLRTWDERFRTRDAKSRNLKHALGEIDRMASALELPGTVRETASVVYRQALDNDLLRGRSIEGVSTAVLYAAARQAQLPRTLDEVAAVSRVDELELKRAYRYVVRELDLEIQPADPESYVARIAGELDITNEAVYRARELLSIAKEQGILSGKSPVGLAAAAVYAGGLLTDGNDVTQARVSEVSEMSEVTIRKRYRELLEAAGVTDN